MTKRHLLYILLLLVIVYQSNGQQVFNIAIISDAAQTDRHVYEQAIKTEIEALLSSQYELRFTEAYTNGDIETISREIVEIRSANEADVLIGAGMVSSKVLANQESFPIPTIAAFLLTDDPPTDTTSENAVSGVSNFTYISSPFNIAVGIEVLQEICRCEKIAVLASPNLLEIGERSPDMGANLDTSLVWLSLTTDLDGIIEEIDTSIGGVYVLSPLTSYTSSEIKQFFDQLNRLQLPSFTMLETPVLEHDAYASFASSDNLKRILRRIAINVEKIAEGKDSKDFPVNVETFTNQLIVNMEAVNKTGKYPKWTLLNDALLININRPYSSRVINLKSTIAEGIENNLGYHIEQKQSEISEKDVALSKSNYLPQLDVETNGFFLDENTVNNSFGTAGSFNWTAGASVSQLILAEPALADIAIQKLLYESQQQVQYESELDVVLEVAERYFTYLLVLSLSELENNNISAINQNLTIAKNKEQAGYGGASDVYRWQTELDLAKTELYEANAQLKSVRYQLNETLNHPIDESFVIEESENFYQLIEQLDETFIALIEDQNILNQFADYMVSEAMQNLPEIRQIQLAISAQDRLLKSNRRSFYLPTIGFGANYDYPITTVNPGEAPPLPGFEAGPNQTWNAAFNVAIPLFKGGARKVQRDRTALGLSQLQDQQQDIKNLLELRVRSNLELVNASYNNIRLSRSAAESAGKNVDIVRDLYVQGQVDVITLVDAQNALLGAQINAASAEYQFMIDSFALQRSTGRYIFLATQEQKEAFFQRFLNYTKN